MGVKSRRMTPIICEGCGQPSYGRALAQGSVINGPVDLYKEMRRLEGLSREQMHVVVINTKNQVLTVVNLYRGSVNTSIARPAEILGCAMKLDAPALAVVHNHPSGDPTPSPEDVELTKRLVEAGKLLDIEVVDHVVIGDGRYLSMRERGLGFGS